MRINPFKAVLDACVLAPMPVADTLLRLGEQSFFTPKWSSEILAELHRTLLKKFGYSKAQADRRIEAMTTAFPEAMVEGYERLLPLMINDAKDRHVTAAAVRCGAHAIVTDNIKHFPAMTLSPFNLDCLTANEFLEHQYHLNPDLFIELLKEQASDCGRTLSELLTIHVPSLSTWIGADHS